MNEAMSDSRLNRRDFLRIATTSLAAGACSGVVVGSRPDGGAGGDHPLSDGGAPADAAGPPPMTRDLASIGESGEFPLGVMAGDATAERAVLWTRYDGGAPLALYVQEAGGEAFTKRR
jgi:hypothetical protein